MAVRIRLKRIGKNVKGRAYYRLVVMEESKSRDGKCLEELGSYNPFDSVVKMKKERYEYWISKGAQPSETVRNLYKRTNKA